MCGIAAILRVYPPGVPIPPLADSVPESWLDILDASFRHRGPDAQGRFRDRVLRSDGVTADVALVHRRLSILDRSGGAQPMLSHPLPLAAGRQMRETSAGGLFHGTPDAPVTYRPTPDDPGLVAVAFNGCIYNHLDLRAQLQTHGCEFRSDHSDTEVLIHGWRIWRERLCDHLVGMFALLLWDRSTGTMLRARDPFGEKPLHTFHVAKDDGWINVFSSVNPASTSLPAAIGRSIVDVPTDSPAATWLRFGWSRSSPTPGSRVIEPSHFELSRPAAAAVPPRASANDLCSLLPPASAPFGPLAAHGSISLPSRSSHLSADDLDRLLRRAVHARLESDVPLGVLLSGGVDSSLIAAYARELIPDLRTFTLRMPVPEYDESRFALAVASTLRTTHHTLDCHANAADDLVHLVTTLGLPFGDSSILPAFWLCRAAREHVTVALSGDGGDELFLGYDRYFAPLALSLPATLARPLARALAWRAPPKSARARAARFLDAAAGLGYWDLLSIFPLSDLRALLGPDTVSNDARRLREDQPRSIEHAQASDLVNYLPDDLLRKTDAASMAVALEVRCPFLDPDLVRAALSAPLSDLLPGGRHKGLLRAVARRYLPPAAMDRPKMGFAIPIGDWFRSNFGGLRTLLLDHLHAADPFPPDLLGVSLNPRYVARIEREHMDGLRDHSQRLFLLLSLAIWCRNLPRHTL